MFARNARKAWIQDGRLAALAVFYLAGLVYLSVTPVRFTWARWNRLLALTEDEGVWAALEAAGYGLTAQNALLSALVAFPLAFLARGAASPTRRVGGHRDATLIWLVLAAATAGVGFVQLFFAAAVLPPLNLPATWTGLLLGMLGWPVLAPPAGRAAAASIAFVRDRMVAARGARPLFPFAATSVLWLVWLSLGPLAAPPAAGSGWSDALRGYLLSGADGAIAQGLWPVLPAALFLQGAFRPARGTGRRLASALAVWAFLTATTLALAALPAGFGRGVPAGVSLWPQQAGILAGILLWWGWASAPVRALASGPARPLRGRGLDKVFWALVTLLPLCLAVEPHTELARVLRPDLGRLRLTPPAEHLYYLIKGAILWLPLGLVFGLAGKGGAAVVWSRAVLLTFLLVAVPLADRIQTGALLEVALATLGILSGGWIGRGLATATGARGPTSQARR